MARIIIQSKQHLGGARLAITGMFKFTKAADSIGKAGEPTFVPFQQEVTLDLVAANTRAKRKAAVIAAITPACAAKKTELLATQQREADEGACDFDLDTDDNGTDVGAI